MYSMTTDSKLEPGEPALMHPVPTNHPVSVFSASRASGRVESVQAVSTPREWLVGGRARRDVQLARKLGGATDRSRSSLC
jgi:hypothetical protein